MKPAATVFSLICAGLLTSCGGQGGEPSQLQNVHFWDVICPKLSYGATNEEAANLIINSQEEFETVWADLGYQAPGEMPVVDFSKGPLIVVYGGFRSTDNEWVSITDIQLSADNQLRVKYDDFTASHPGCGGNSVVAYPFCIVQADINAESAEFERTELNSCEVTEKPDL